MVEFSLDAAPQRRLMRPGAGGWRRLWRGLRALGDSFARARVAALMAEELARRGYCAAATQARLKAFVLQDHDGHREG